MPKLKNYRFTMRSFCFIAETTTEAISEEKAIQSAVIHLFGPGAEWFEAFGMPTYGHVCVRTKNPFSILNPILTRVTDMVKINIEELPDTPE